MGDHKAYDVVVNLINYNTGKYKTFKNNFVDYVREKENDRRTFNYDGYVAKAVEILGNELNNDNLGIAMAMNHIIKNNPNILKGFKDIYENQYAQYLKK